MMNKKHLICSCFVEGKRAWDAIEVEEPEPGPGRAGGNMKEGENMGEREGDMSVGIASSAEAQVVAKYH